MTKETKIITHSSGEITLAWLIHAEKKSVQFTVLLYSTNKNQTNRIATSLEALPSDLGYHADEPQYKGQTDMECCYRPSGACYYAGSSLNAQTLWNEYLAAKSDTVIWKRLESML